MRWKIRYFQEAQIMRRHCFILLLLFYLFLTGCGMVPISAQYKRYRIIRPVYTSKPRVNLQVSDIREKKVFFRTALGDTTDSGGGGVLRLSRKPREIFEEGFTEALQSAGCELRSDADIIYEVGIKRFLAMDESGTSNFIRSDIVLDVRIKQKDGVLAQKTIFVKDKEHQGFMQVWQDVVPPLLSRSVTDAIESAVLDPELIAAID